MKNWPKPNQAGFYPADDAEVFLLAGHATSPTATIRLLQIGEESWITAANVVMKGGGFASQLDDFTQKLRNRAAAIHYVTDSVIVRCMDYQRNPACKDQATTVSNWAAGLQAQQKEPPPAADPPPAQTSKPPAGPAPAKQERNQPPVSTIKKLILAGAQIRHSNQYQEEGVFKARVHFQSDVTRDFAAALQWDAIYKEDMGWTKGYQQMKLPGKLMLSSIHMKANGMKQEVDVEAAEAKGFLAVHLKDLIQIRFAVTFPGESWDALWQYWQMVGDADARMQLRLSGDKQESIDFSAAHEEPGDAEPAGEEKEDGGPALGTALKNVGGGTTEGLKKAKARGRAAAKAPQTVN